MGQPRRLTIDATDFLMDGKPYQIISGSITYYRMLPEQWRDRLEKIVALGCNTIEVYVPWNFHEPKKGQFRFDGSADLVAFLEIAGELGLDILFRPGPYICAEWEFGGLPWWLNVEDDIELRCSNPAYLKAVDAWWEELLPRVNHLLSTNGGPIVAVQIENEYGYFGDDKVYLEHLRDKLRELGVDVLLFTSDGPYGKETLSNGGLPDVLRTANFGSNPGPLFKNLRAFQPEGPMMCMEFWIGWFDAWGNQKKSARDPQNAADDLKTMLDMNASANFFMAVGGTSFGFWSGSNLSDRYEPHVTSYDYDGLMTECGDITEKYTLCRDVIAKHTGQTLPEPGADSKKIAPGEVKLTQSAALADALGVLSKRVEASKPLPIEKMGEGYGYAWYEADIPASYSGRRLVLRGMRDFAHVRLNGESLGTWYVNDEQPEWTPEFEGETARLEILVDCMARANFGHQLKLLKGISEGVYFGPRRHDERAHFGWASHALPMEDLSQVPWSDDIQTEGPRFFRGTFEVSELGDTFLELPGFTKGFACVNGFNLGRYWNIGPQFSLYVPGDLLREGANEVVVFETVGCESATVRLGAEPVWAR